jgi:hypothetical protein
MFIDYVANKFEENEIKKYGNQLVKKTLIRL